MQVMIYLSNSSSFILADNLQYNQLLKCITLSYNNIIFGSLDVKEVSLKYSSTLNDKTKIYNLALK